MVKKTRKITLIAFAALCLTGCGKDKSSRDYEVTIDSYEKVTAECYEVTCADMVPNVSLHLMNSSATKVPYHCAKPEMKVESCNIQRGDVVKKGQVLVTFQNDEIDEKIKQYQQQLEEDQLMLEHYQRLMKMDSGMCTDEDIKMIKNDITVDQAYLSELKSAKELYMIRAEGDGVVTSVSNILKFGEVSSTDELFSVFYSDGTYYAETDDPFPCKPGQIFTAESEEQSYQFKVTKVLEAAENESGNGRRIEFEYVSENGEVPTTTEILIDVKLEELKGVIFIPEDTVVTDDDEHTYVRVLNEEGYGCKREVQVSSYVDGYAIISSGLQAGEKVVVQ